ncbi:MAG: hypothetical protein Faunusvirus22_9 [Faunusvirus sp.]|jgi:TPR repeat protein|uniref:Sel1 repeat family protein n=1 Tax=Faunusvirus sp. TaxID=2487766 RepID=A0A3G4ZXB0_9VIRU|nr:MAG: hypothetical protein Faunusvirus22_9 [Faunusvirus sp.]
MNKLDKAIELFGKYEYEQSLQLLLQYIDEVSECKIAMKYIYRTSIFTVIDKTAKWLTDMAASNMYAKLYLGWLHYNGDDVATAYRIFTEISESYHTAAASALVGLGQVYEHHRHVTDYKNDPDDKNAIDKASHIYYYTAIMEEQAAPYYMGLLMGREDYRHRYNSQAIEHFTAAAEYEYIPAMMKLGELYEHVMEAGYEHAVNQDIKKAIEWYKRAATLGYYKAQLKLAELYTELKQNDLAFYWHCVAIYISKKRYTIYINTDDKKNKRQKLISQLAKINYIDRYDIEDADHTDQSDNKRQKIT